MKKIRIFKTSYLKRKLRECIIKLFSIDFKINSVKSSQKKLLIISLDALGDNIVKSRTIEIFTENYGKDNIYILCKNKWKILYEIQGYKNIFVDETKWNVFYKIKLYRKLNRVGFSEVAILNHSYVPEESNFIYCDKKYDMSEDVNYILEKHLIILKKVLNKDFNLNDVVPDIRKYFPNKKYSNVIAIAVGASGDSRTMAFKYFKNIIYKLAEKFKNKDIVLLGAGNKQEIIAKKILEELNLKNVKENIDKISLLETIQIINDSDLFIGGDSGLLNIAFSLKKKSICLHWSLEKFVWEHPFNNIKILKGKGGEKFKDKKYGTETLNSITFEQIENAIDELGIK